MGIEIGDLVLCIDNDDAPSLKLGSAYIVKSLDSSGANPTLVILVNLPKEHCFYSFSFRFKSLGKPSKFSLALYGLEE